MKIDKTHAGCLREAACSVNPGPGATGIQADSTFHPELLSENKHRREGVGTHRKNGGLLQLAINFCEKMPLHVSQQARGARESLLTVPGMSGLARRGCDSHFILIYLFVDEHTHSSQTYRGHYATLKSSRGNGERQRRAWW